jgi:hypothetical protein
LTGTVQYNAEVSGSLTVSDVCKTMTSGDPYQQFLELNKQVIGWYCPGPLWMHDFSVCTVVYRTE